MDKGLFKFSSTRKGGGRGGESDYGVSTKLSPSQRSEGSESEFSGGGEATNCILINQGGGKG
jgi:hypothetical protein